MIYDNESPKFMWCMPRKSAVEPYKSQGRAKIEAQGNKNLIITERGTSFGYNNLVSDMRSLVIMRSFGYPVIYDASHSVQLPSGKGEFSSGERKFVLPLSRAAVAFGCDGLFIETHINPDAALCDGPNMIDLNQLRDLLIQVTKIDEVLRNVHKTGQRSS